MFTLSQDIVVPLPHDTVIPLPNDKFIQPHCVSVGCVCVGSDIAPLIKVYCPNQAINKCYSQAKCEMQQNCSCGYTPSKSLTMCLHLAQNPIIFNPCHITGCNNMICSDEPMALTDVACMIDERATCFKNAECVVQENGKCNWTMTRDLMKCVIPTPIPMPNPIPGPDPISITVEP
jgi:hypothetical protein